MLLSTFDNPEIIKKKKLIIEKSKDLGFDVIGFANIARIRISARGGKLRVLI